MENRWALYFLQLTVWRKFPAIAQERGIQMESDNHPELTWCGWEVKVTKLKLIGQSTREERATQRENPGDLHSVFLESSTDDWSVHMCGETSQVVVKDHLNRNRTWSSHKAESSLCSHLQECKNPCNSWDFEVLRRYYLSIE